MNRGRHRKRDQYPKEVNELKNPETFKKYFTPAQAELLLMRQAQAGNPRNLRVFEETWSACRTTGGFTWDETTENWDYWHELLWNYHVKLEYNE